jgi:hypothetical protein
MKNSGRIRFSQISFSIRLITGLICLWYIISRLNEAIDNGEMYSLLSAIRSEAGFYYFTATFVLVFLNWGIEAIKWMKLCAPFQKITWVDSFKAVCAGVSMGIFTPNRIGETGGRVLRIQPGNRTAGVFASIQGGLAQLSITLICGGIACFFPRSIPDTTPFLWGISFGTISLLIGLAILPIVYKPTLLKSIQKIIPRYAEKIQNASIQTDNKLITEIFIWSFLRYFVFCTQFLLLLRLFGVEPGISNSYLMISLVFLITTAIPTFALTEIAARSSAAIFIFGIGGYPTLSVASAGFALWILNIALPATAGIFFLPSIKNTAQ